MKTIAHLDTTGRVISLQVVSEAHATKLAESANIVVVANNLKGQVYVSKGVLMRCKDYVIEAIPKPCWVKVQGQQYRVEAGSNTPQLNPEVDIIEVVPDDPAYAVKTFKPKTG